MATLSSSSSSSSSLCSSNVSRPRCFHGFSQRLSLTPLQYDPSVRLRRSCTTSFPHHRSCIRSFFRETNGDRRKLPDSEDPSSSSLNIEERPANISLSPCPEGSFAKNDDNNELEEEEEEDGDQIEDGYRMTRVCDRLIEVFLIEKTKPEEWRKLLAFSKEWTNIRDHFFKRCKVRAEQEIDPKRKGDLLKLSRKLKEVDDDMTRHNELLECVKEQIEDLHTIVTRRRKDFTNDFFHHLELLYHASYADPDQQTFLAGIGNKCVEAVEAHDRMSEEGEAMDAAQMKFNDILNSPSLDVARNKIDNLMKRNELDSNLMLLVTKAWASSKESNMMKDEVKDILFHLYNVSIGNLQRLVPKEVRIMRHIISLEDPKEQISALSAAFSPGDELEGNDIDLLYTTPEKLHNWIVIVLDAYYHDKRSTLMKSAQQLMNPALIKRLEILKKTIEAQFL